MLEEVISRVFDTKREERDNYGKIPEECIIDPHYHIPENDQIILCENIHLLEDE